MDSAEYMLYLSGEKIRENRVRQVNIRGRTFPVPLMVMATFVKEKRVYGKTKALRKNTTICNGTDFQPRFQKKNLEFLFQSHYNYYIK